MEEKNENKSTLVKVKEETEKLIDCILEEGIQSENVDFLYKIVDIHKDIANEEYWNIKKEEDNMRYRAYGNSYNESGNYNAGGNYGRDAYGEYSDGGNYGRRERDSRGRYTARGYDSKYRGEEMMDEMMYHYGNYNEGREQYGSDGQTMESFKFMLKSFKDFFKHLEKEASSQQEVEMLKKTAREISEM